MVLPKYITSWENLADPSLARNYSPQTPSTSFCHFPLPPTISGWLTMHNAFAITLPHPQSSIVAHNVLAPSPSDPMCWPVITLPKWQTPFGITHLNCSLNFFPPYLITMLWILLSKSVASSTLSKLCCRSHQIHDVLWWLCHSGIFPHASIRMPASE